MSGGFDWLEKDRKLARRDLARAYGFMKRQKPAAAPDEPQITQIPKNELKSESASSAKSAAAVQGGKLQTRSVNSVKSVDAGRRTEVPSLAQRIGGESLPPASGNYLDNVDPARNVVLCRVPRGSATDVEAAVSAAKSAQPKWAALTMKKRCAILRKTAELIERDLERLARLESEDTGKPIRLCKNLDIPRAARNFRFYADFLENHKDPEHRSDGHTHKTLRAPVGVVGLITPWNLPLYLLTWKVAPALGMGNAVVAKPSELTPRTADALADILTEAGLPGGLYNLIHGLGPEAGEPLIRHPDVRAISFTGGTATGAKVAQAAAAGTSPKKLSLELGGKNPAIVFADCDLDAAVAGVVRGGYTNGGQICLCTSRVLVESSLLPKFLPKLKDAVTKLKLGDPLDAATDIGSLNSHPHREKVEGYLALAKKEGCEVTGGARPKMKGELATGAFLEPAIITEAKQQSRLIQEEIFGPVVTVQGFKDEAEAVALANGVRYGLTATLWTKDTKKAERVAAKLETGMVWINCWLVRDLATPFGGIKDSGVGREGGEWSVDFYSEARNVTVPD